MQHETIEVIVPSHYVERLETFANIRQCTPSEVVVRGLELLFTRYFDDAREQMSEAEFQALMEKLHQSIEPELS